MSYVAPLAGAWIEIMKRSGELIRTVSLPSRERGLKCLSNKRQCRLYGSLPSRERGLKFLGTDMSIEEELSLPSRERGLKLHQQVNVCLFIASLPSRERGLKSFPTITPRELIPVAPLAGAWIEISA